MATRFPRRRNDGRPQRAFPPERSCLDQPYSRVPYLLPDGRQIPVYRDSHGVLVTDYGGPTRPVADVYSEALSHDPPTPVQISDLRTRPNDQQAEPTPNHGPSRAQSAEAPQQTPTPNPGPTRAVAAQQMSQWSDVFSLTPTRLLVEYFVRVDKGGFFHVYPDRGGPFRSLQEAQQAIDSYHAVGRKNLCMDGLSSMEMSVRYALYWHHDGTRKNSAEAFAAMATYEPVQEVVKALLDKFNEDNGCFGDLACELKDIVSYNPCFDGKGCAYRSYSHLNMTMKTKGAEDELFFAEITCMDDQREEYMLTCICTVGPDDNGECHVCGDEVKHPTDAEYKHGRFQPLFGCCSYADADDLYDELVTVRDEAWLKEEEARVRRMFKESDEAIKVGGHGKGVVMLKEADEPIKMETIGGGHGERAAKYVVPARRK